VYLLLLSDGWRCAVRLFGRQPEK